MNQPTCRVLLVFHTSMISGRARTRHLRDNGYMEATAITYRSGPRKSVLRTVLVSDVRQSVVLLPTGTFDLLIAKLLHGSQCAHSFWAEELGLDPESDEFIPADKSWPRGNDRTGKPRYQGVFADGVLTIKTNCKETT